MNFSNLPYYLAFPPKTKYPHWKQWGYFMKNIILVGIIGVLSISAYASEDISKLAPTLFSGSFSDDTDRSKTINEWTDEDITDYCSSVAEIAKSAMKARQRGGSFNEMYNINLDNPALTDLAKYAVIDAHKYPLFKDKVKKEHAVENFKNDAYRLCVEQFNLNMANARTR